MATDAYEGYLERLHLGDIVYSFEPTDFYDETIPAVKKALAAKASKLLKPASSRKSVLIPQISAAAKVLPSVRVK